MSLKFKKIEVSGFKSFADKLEIKFGEGITAIVGPNGCGKSNVADSIRWVLGEQSAKLLRGNSMQDVIFKGTEKRKSLSFCEVSLYFDNTEKWFSDLSYDEVVISRKLYRSGESEYFINKQPCLLRNITEYLRDAGMGREGYSIIGQGRVEGLLSAKPEDRRAIFEEAAGISKFKARKNDTERKLLKTRDNLTRINDILAEKLNTLEPLTKQAEAARKYLELEESLRRNEMNIYMHQYESAEMAKSAISERLSVLNGAIETKNRECDEAVAAYNEAMQNFGSVDRNIEGLRAQELALTVGMEKKAGEINLLTVRLKYLNTQNSQLMSENEVISADIRDAEEKAAQCKSESEKKKYELSMQRARKEKLDDTYFKLMSDVRAHEEELDTNHREMLEAMNRLTEIKSNMSSLVAEKQTLSNLISELSRKKFEYSDNLTALKAACEVGTSEKKALIDKKNSLQAETEVLQARNAECVDKLAKLSSEIESLNEKYYMSKSRMKMLKDMHDAFDGFANSVKNLLLAGKNEVAVGSKILGVVAQLIKVEPKFETAIEMSLGNAMQNIVVENEDDAKYLIAYLKKMRYGRVTFLPISSVKPRSIDSAYRRFLNASGVFGVASELISCDSRFNSVVSGLLGGTVIVDNMDTAVTLARSTGFSFKIVTLEGDIINPSGAITGGSKKADIANIFSHDRELKEITVKVEEYETALGTMNGEKKSFVCDQQSVSSDLKARREELHAVELELAAKAEGLNKSAADVDTLEGQVKSLADDIARHAQRIADIDCDINSVGDLEQTIEEKRKIAEGSSKDRQQKFDILKNERDKLGNVLADLRLTIATTENILNTLNNEISRLENNITAMSDKLQRATEQISANTVLIRQLDEELDALSGTQRTEDSSRVDDIRIKLSNLDEYKSSLQEKMTEVDAARVRLMNELSDLREKKSGEEMQLLKVDTDIEQMQQHILEAYNCDYEQCLPFKQADFNLEKGSVENNRLKRQIKALGYVNVGAIEQSKVAYEEYHNMDVQREDLQKAEADLMKILKEISDEMLGRFNEQFQKIRENFIKIFKELFDGGFADLIIQESEDPLEAGIEIVAQPPEKNLQSISLLSGGERALTAIAILFAILRLKPMPFCVLDEIEAALDDANAGRFARYLRRFSEETQFIVITHRKPTMELADNLYGVTMEEKGVSKIVSVKLSEAVAAAESMS